MTYLQALLIFLFFGLTSELILFVKDVVHNLYFHPLRAFPGPIAYRASRLPYVFRALKGTLATEMLGHHEAYGPVVRIAPNELSFADPAAWKDIMAQKPGALEAGKWEDYYKPRDPHPTSIMYAPTEDHARLRRQMAFGFSDKSMREQEPVMQRYINLFIRRLLESCHKGPVDMAQWFNFTTFDLIGDLAFGESFGCLESSAYHPWVRPIFEVTHMSAVMSAAAHYPVVKKALMKLLPLLFGKKIANHQVYTRTKLVKRMAMERADLIDGLLKEGDTAINMDELVTNASILVVAGSETTATVLAGVTYFLATNPSKLSRLCDEVRGTFKSEDEITINKASQLEFMLACLDEAMRLYPPVPVGLPRIVPKGGRHICGHFVPEKTHVAIWQWAMYHNSSLFVDAFGFHPERFMKESRADFSLDIRDTFQPFHVGQRNCIGRTLAYAEMRLMLAKLVFNFDMQLADESRDWLEHQKAYNLWYKPALLVHLTPREDAIVKVETS